MMMIVAIAKRLRTKSAKYRFLEAHADALVARLGLPRFPARSTYFQRSRTASVLMVAAAAAHTDNAAARGRIDVRCVAADKTLIAAVGPHWHKAQRARGERPKGVDGEASWSRSAHDGWVYGYGLEAVVTASRRRVIWRLMPRPIRRTARGEDLPGQAAAAAGGGAVRAGRHGLRQQRPG